MKEIQIKLEIKMEGEKKTRIITKEIDNEKWEKIINHCNARKADIIEVIEDYLERITPEKAEEILLSWDF